MLRLQNTKKAIEIQKRKTLTYKGKLNKITSNFSAESLKAIDVLMILNCQPRLLYPAMLSFKTDGCRRPSKTTQTKAIHDY
jgi:hypothetical protein